MAPEMAEQGLILLTGILLTGILLTGILPLDCAQQKSRSCLAQERHSFERYQKYSTTLKKVWLTPGK